MRAPPSEHADDSTPFRGLGWATLIAACACVFGLLIGARAGGFGPMLMWLGGVVAAATFVLDRALQRLRGRVRSAAATVCAALGIGVQVAAIAFFMQEFVSRWHDDNPPYRWDRQNELTEWDVPHPRLGWSGAKNYTAVVELPTGPMSLRLNSRGFRDIEQPVDPTRQRIVILGDSYPIAWGESVDASAGTRLRAALPEYQVFDAACVGYQIDQIALSYAVHARPLGASAVVLMYLAEPGVTGSLPIHEGRRKPWYELDHGRLRLRGLPLQFDATAAANQRMYREFEARGITGLTTAWRFLTQTLPRRYLVCGPLFAPRWDWPTIDREGLPPMDPVELAVLADLRRQLAADGVALVVSLAPHPVVLAEAADPVRAMQPYLDSLRRIGIEPIDLTARVMAEVSSQNTPNAARDWSSFYNAAGHPNGKGLDLVVPTIASRLRELLR